MKAVGIKLLKSKLSEYLRLVRTGETILVMERDEVVAEMRPARRQGLHSSDLEERLSELAERGLVTLRICEPKSWGQRRKKIRRPRGFVSESLLDTLREEAK